ncbi:HEPN domain-containing protein [Chelatococcus sambhunathii]|uniref:HEPN domain-containing protein n=1 Tax=Chelatococcus sambhunathii TaxID=363953 RepID=A0ABU1DDG9_9HYPH|nr:HEPN domain-containing protein [Chelatococcus sambhunathii]MDR4306158.1 HEPN domain-containing protein [Chelatococcus sambhunathii]
MSVSDELMAKAERALTTASVVLDDGDSDAAAGRAYYAAFNAARAALASVAEVDPEAIKTHSGLIARFSEALIRTGVVGADLGRTLAVLAKDRAVADYDGRVIEAGKAAQDVALAKAFVAEIRRLLSPESDAP